MPKFEKLRISLARDEEPGGLLEGTEGDNPHLSRSEFLLAAFSEPRDFLNERGTLFNFLPMPAPDGYMAGFFARHRPVPLKHADLIPYMAENYEPAMFVISLDKAQIAWFEDKGSVGSPKRILESFFDHLLKKTDLKDWRAFVRYFENEQDYWTVVRERRMDITKIVFRYVPPNAFGGRKLAQEYHKEVQRQAKATEVEETFRGPAGSMDPESEMMKENAEIAEQGAGERELRGRNNQLLYRSKEGRVIESVPEEDMPTVENTPFVRRVIDRLFGR